MRSLLAIVAAVVALAGCQSKSPYEVLKPKPETDGRVTASVTCGNGLNYGGPDEHVGKFIELCDKIIDKDADRVMLNAEVRRLKADVERLSPKGQALTK